MRYMLRFPDLPADLPSIDAVACTQAAIDCVHDAAASDLQGFAGYRNPLPPACTTEDSENLAAVLLLQNVQINVAEGIGFCLSLTLPDLSADDTAALERFAVRMFDAPREGSPALAIVRNALDYEGQLHASEKRIAIAKFFDAAEVSETTTA